MSKNKLFNSTLAGQLAMCADASSKAVAFTLNKKVKALGGTGWDDSWISTANDVLLISIKENLIEEYNALLKAKQGKEPSQ